MATKKRSKFNVDMSKNGEKKRTIDGITFDSQMEANYYKDYLLPLKEEGIITKIEAQVSFILQPGFTKNGKKYLPITYIADFVETYSDGHVEVCDVKGFVTPDFKIKAKLMNYVYRDVELKLIGYSRLDGGFVTLETIEKGRKARKKAKTATKRK